MLSYCVFPCGGQTTKKRNERFLNAFIRHLFFALNSEKKLTLFAQSILNVRRRFAYLYLNLKRPLKKQIEHVESVIT